MPNNPGPNREPIEIEYRKTKPEVIHKLEKTLQNKRIGVVTKKRSTISNFS